MDTPFLGLGAEDWQAIAFSARCVGRGRCWLLYRLECMLGWCWPPNFLGKAL